MPPGALEHGRHRGRCHRSRRSPRQHHGVHQDGQVGRAATRSGRFTRAGRVAGADTGAPGSVADGDQNSRRRAPTPAPGARARRTASPPSGSVPSPCGDAGGLRPTPSSRSRFSTAVLRAVAAGRAAAHRAPSARPTGDRLFGVPSMTWMLHTRRGRRPRTQEVGEGCGQDAACCDSRPSAVTGRARRNRGVRTAPRSPHATTAKSAARFDRSLLRTGLLDGRGV